MAKKQNNPEVEVEIDDILNQTLDDAEPPSALPDGFYSGAIEGHEFTETSVKKFPCANLFIRLDGALDGVDEVDLENCLKGEMLSTRTLRQMFLLTEKHRWRIKKFAVSAGIDVTGVPLKEVLAGLDNLQVKVQVETVLTAEDDPREVNQVASIRPLE